MNAYDMLRELCEQNQFELLIDNTDYKLVYLMNDAVESFLILHNATITGTYDPDYEGETAVDYHLAPESSLKQNPSANGSTDNDAHIDDTDSDVSAANRHHIIARQGASVITIFFDSVSLEMHLYNYGKLGHFWVPKYEYLRLLEYRISILRDKLDYIGPEACTEEEQILASLAEFPPLNYCCYPSAPLKYIAEREHPWVPSSSALDLMDSLAKEASDWTMRLFLSLYRKMPAKWIARYIAHLMHLKTRKKLVSLLDQKIKTASASYPDRDLGSDLNARRTALTEKAETMLASIEAAGFDAEIVIEEPFTTAQDDLELSAYVMTWYNSFSDRTSHIQKISPDSN